MGDTTNEHRIGELSARVDGLDDGHDDIKLELRELRKEFAEFRKELSVINQQIAAAGGGWKVLLVMGTMIAAVSAMVTSWLHR